MFCGLVTGNQAIYYPSPVMYIITPKPNKAAMPFNYKPTKPEPQTALLAHRPPFGYFCIIYQIGPPDFYICYNLHNHLGETSSVPVVVRVYKLNEFLF